MKKFVTALLLCVLVIAALSGCQSKGFALTSFDGLTLSELQKKVNSKMELSGIKLPAFEKKTKESGEVYYLSEFEGTYLMVNIVDDGQMLMVVTDKAVSDDLEMTGSELYKIARGVIAVVDPDASADLFALILTEGSAKSDKYRYTYVEDDKLAGILIGE